MNECFRDGNTEVFGSSWQDEQVRMRKQSFLCRSFDHSGHRDPFTERAIAGNGCRQLGTIAIQVRPCEHEMPIRELGRRYSAPIKEQLLKYKNAICRLT